VILISSLKLKRMNRNKVYKYILSEEKLSKADIAKDLGLSLPTVVQYVNELMSLDLVVENGKFQSTGGRKATAVSCNENARYAIGIDITKKHINAVLLNLKGTVVDFKRVRCNFSDCDGYYQIISSLIEEIIVKNKVDREKVIGVGISIPAIVISEKSFGSKAIAEMPHDLYDKLEPYVHFQYRFFNDSNSGGFAEQWVWDSSKTITYFSLSDTVGGAIISNGGIYYGDNMRSGEFGHMVINPNGKRCYCGNIGCVDVYCSSRVLSDHADGSLEKFFEYVDKGDKKYVDIFNEYLNNLVLAIYNIRMCFDCDIILGGYMGRFLGKYLDEIKELVKEKNMFFQKDADFIKAGKFSFEAAAVGSALYYIDQFINNI
jgi:predicted NBD/HSP70 family sugar kinase